MTNIITFRATDEEMIAIAELCKKMELSPERILRQALRLYQAVSLGVIKTVPETPVGCGSDE